MTRKVDKTQKYDRQIRLWATNGQANIENCHVCVIGITTTNIELLKNLVLPGCGNFTIVDDGRPRDLSHNFFWSEESSLIQNLQDLNPDVKGSVINRSVSDLLENETSAFWNQFTIVVMDDSIDTWEKEKELIGIFWDLGTPIIKNVSYGFYGLTRIIVKEHSIIETHPESLVDLRVANTWKELEEYTDSIDLDSMDETDHAHVPYVVILVKAIKSWRLAHNGEAPTSSSRVEFKKYIEDMSRSPDEMNFQQAVQYAHRATNPPALGGSVAEIIDSCPTPNLATPIFWIYTKALQNFIQHNDQQLPLSGVLPDMTSDTANYVNLQTIYKNKFIKDRDALLQEVKSIVNSIGRSADDVNEELATIFCKNAKFLRVQAGSKDILSNRLLAECSPSHYQAHYLKVYLAFLSVENLKKSGSGLKLYDAEKNSSYLGQSARSLFRHYNIDEGFYDDEFEQILQEFARSGCSELHNIASFTGGVGSQEALKFITGQYVPLDNLLIFDGIVSHTECLKI